MMLCELPFQLCLKACRSSLLSACEQRRRSWTRSDKPSRPAVSQGPDTWHPATQTDNQHPNSGLYGPNLHARMSIILSHFSSKNYLSSTSVYVPSRFRRVNDRDDSLSCVKIFWSPADVTWGFPDMFKLTRAGQEARHLKKEWTGLHPELPVSTKKQQNTHQPGQGGNISICQPVSCQAQVGQCTLLLLKERVLVPTGRGKART